MGTEQDRHHLEDRHHLARALELAEGGRGRVSPNPLVGCVIVRDGVVLGEGHHSELGGAHAERAALAACRAKGEDPHGATMYVSLEPCAHTGRQPPCTEAILEGGISRVVIGCDDPSQKASGRGPAALRDARVAVSFATGPEAAAARLLVQPFRKRARTGRPLVTYKVAATLDGRVTMPEGTPRWISGVESRELVHRWRAEADAVAIGIGTALADDPLLSARDVGAPRQPARVVFDSEARLPLESKLVGSIDEAPLYVVVAPEASAARTKALRDAGAEIVVAPGADRAASLRAALDELGRREISELILEGGPTLSAAFLEAGEIDELRLFIAPVLSGSRGSPGVIAGADSLGEAIQPLAVEHQTSGPDLLIRARLREW